MKKTFAAVPNTMIIIIFSCSIFSRAFGTPPSAISPAINNPANCHSYILLETSSWTDAEAAAVLLGGHLVTVNDAAEETFIWDTFRSYGGTDRSLWIGLNDSKKEGDFKWSSGEIIYDPLKTYTHWETHEPNNWCGPENYVHIFPPYEIRASFWNDNTDDGYGACTKPTGWATYGIVEIPCPVAIIAPTAASLVCVIPSEISVLLTANDGTCISYQWYKDGIIITGATSETFTAKHMGTYTVTETTAEGCSVTTSCKVSGSFRPKAFISAPHGLEICATGRGHVMLKANAGTGISYKWYRDGIALTGITSRIHFAKKAGVFTVEVTNDSGCTHISSPVTVTKTGCK